MKYSTHDERRVALYLSMLEICTLFRETIPGGRDGALVAMVVALNSIAGEATNISSISDVTGLDRRSVRRLLDLMIEEGFMVKRQGEQGWPVYDRSLTDRSEETISNIVDSIYNIIQTRMFPPESLQGDIKRVFHKAANTLQRCGCTDPECPELELVK